MFSRLLLLVIAVSTLEACGDYYWRKYNGIIPYDAIPAGKDSNGKLLYIGQGYIHNAGIFYGTITPLKKNITVASYGIPTTDMVKILCARNHAKYYWLKVDADTYANKTMNKCPVQGGLDQKRALIKRVDFVPLDVGRTLRHASVNVGSVEVVFYYAYGGVERCITSNYEVLVYSDVPLAIYDPPLEPQVVPISDEYTFSVLN